MRPGTNDQKSTKPNSTPSPESIQESPARLKERELFARMAKVKQYPMAPDDPDFQKPVPSSP